MYYRKDTTMILNRRELDFLVDLVEDYHTRETKPLPLSKILLNRLYHAQKMTGYTKE